MPCLQSPRLPAVFPPKSHVVEHVAFSVHAAFNPCPVVIRIGAHERSLSYRMWDWVEGSLVLPVDAGLLQPRVLEASLLPPRAFAPSSDISCAYFCGSVPVSSVGVVHLSMS